MEHGNRIQLGACLRLRLLNPAAHSLLKATSSGKRFILAVGRQRPILCSNSKPVLSIALEI